MNWGRESTQNGSCVDNRTDGLQLDGAPIAIVTVAASTARATASLAVRAESVKRRRSRWPVRIRELRSKGYREALGGRLSGREVSEGRSFRRPAHAHPSRSPGGS